jgi:hypothetical protein
VARVGAVLVDYDGTIAPLGVPRTESRIFRSVEAELRTIAGSAAVCIVTAKDFGFIHHRSRFATGWACASGLDIRFADGRVIAEKGLADLKEALNLALAAEKLGTYTELKRGPDRELLAVTIDWTGAPEAGAFVVRRLKPLAEGGLFVAHERGTTYADVYAARPDKGRASRLITKMLAVQGYVMFIGDSSLDNSAFQAADIAVGVAHGQPMERLTCEFIVEQARLAEFLRSLSGRGMDFSPTMAAVRSKEGLKRVEGRSSNVSDEPHKGTGARRPTNG